jgi:hypothetical protein
MDALKQFWNSATLLQKIGIGILLVFVIPLMLFKSS